MLLFGLFSLGAVSVGALVCIMSDVPIGLSVRNLAAWVIGGLTAATIARTAGPRALPYILWTAPLALAASFLGPDQEGVHRWVSAGPVTLNVAMLVLPMAVVALAGLCRARRWTWLPALLGLGVLAWQPDASQATSLGLAILFLAGVNVVGVKLKTGVALAAPGLVAAAWLRPDPLQPVPEVEDVLELAWGLSPLLAGLALALLAGFAVAPILAARRAPGDLRIAAAALSLCLAAWIVTTFAGHFPVPLAGVGLYVVRTFETGGVRI